MNARGPAEASPICARRVASRSGPDQEGQPTNDLQQMRDEEVRRLDPARGGLALKEQLTPSAAGASSRNEPSRFHFVAGIRRGLPENGDAKKPRL